MDQIVCKVGSEGDMDGTWQTLQVMIVVLTALGAAISGFDADVPIVCQDYFYDCIDGIPKYSDRVVGWWWSSVVVFFVLWPSLGGRGLSSSPLSLSSFIRPSNERYFLLLVLSLFPLSFCNIPQLWRGPKRKHYLLPTDRPMHKTFNNQHRYHRQHHRTGTPPSTPTPPQCTSNK